MLHAWGCKSRASLEAQGACKATPSDALSSLAPTRGSFVTTSLNTTWSVSGRPDFDYL